MKGNSAEWENDRALVMSTGASFPVKLLGLVDVEKGRGVEICEEAVYSLKGHTKNKRKLTFMVRADYLRSVDVETEEIVFEQPIEKVSFCSPFPGHTRLFSFIARDTTAKKWVCHCFASLKEPGERVCHAMGCAFTACMRRQQNRIAELNKQRAAKRAKEAEAQKKAKQDEKPMPVRLGLQSGAELLFDDTEMEDMPDPSQMACAPALEPDKTTRALELAIAEVEQALQQAKIKTSSAPSSTSEVTDAVDLPDKTEGQSSEPVMSVANTFTDLE